MREERLFLPMSFHLEISILERDSRKTAALKYVEGSEVYSIEKKKGWFGRLSAPGYMDATEWQGPYRTERQALDAVKDFHEVDDEGESWY